MQHPSGDGTEKVTQELQSLEEKYAEAKRKLSEQSNVIAHLRSKDISQNGEASASNLPVAFCIQAYIVTTAVDIEAHQHCLKKIFIPGKHG